MVKKRSRGDDRVNDLQLKQAIYLAIQQGKSDNVALLIDENKNAIAMTTPFGTWLHVAASLGNLPIMKLFLKKGIDINVKGGVLGGNALNYAASRGQLEAVKFLFSRGGEFDTSDPTRNPLFSAIVSGHLSVAKFLIEKGIDISVKYSGENMKNTGALEFATKHQQWDIARLLTGRTGPSEPSKSISEMMLSPADLEMIAMAVSAGKKLLGRGVKNIQGKINSFVERWFSSKLKKSRHDKSAAIALGALWGQHIVDDMDWEWIKINDNGIVLLCISDELRKYLIMPLYLFTQMRDKGIDKMSISPLALYNSIVGGNLPKSNEGNYLVVTIE